MGTLPYSIKCLAECRIAFGRFQKFLLLPEYKHPNERPFEEEEEYPTEAGKALRICMKNANLGWYKAVEVVPENKNGWGDRKIQKFLFYANWQPFSV